MVTRAQMRGTEESGTSPLPPVSGEIREAPEIDPETADEIAANEAADAFKLPTGVHEDADGSWVYTLQHPLEPTKDDPEGKDLGKVRIPATTYARNVRYASRMAESEVEVIFFLGVSMTKVPESLFDRMDARDYSAISKLVIRRTSTNPR